MFVVFLFPDRTEKEQSRFKETEMIMRKRFIKTLAVTGIAIMLMIPCNDKNNIIKLLKEAWHGEKRFH